MIDLNKFYEAYTRNPEGVRRDLLKKAEKEIAKAVDSEYYSASDITDQSDGRNYAEICEWLGWPDMQDGGFFEKLIDEACNNVYHRQQAAEHANNWLNDYEYRLNRLGYCPERIKNVMEDMRGTIQHALELLTVNPNRL